MHFARSPFLLLAMLTATACIGNGAVQPYAVDSAESRILIEVGKTGALSFLAGHAHEVQGSVTNGALEIDTDDPTHSQVRISIDAAALTVTGKGESPADVPKVQQTMMSDRVLDVTRFPRIAFESSGVTVVNRTVDAFDLSVTGTLTLHGTRRPLTIPVHVDLAPHRVTGAGRFTIEQTNFGIKPVSVGGVVSVKNELNVSFRIVGVR